MKQRCCHVVGALTLTVLAVLILAPCSATAQTASRADSGTRSSADSEEQAASVESIRGQATAVTQQIPARMMVAVPEELPAQAPRVSFDNGQLTIDAQNSSLKDVLTAICLQIGAGLDIAPGIADSRIAVHLAGSPRQVISMLLYDPGLGYILIGLPGNAEGVQKIFLRNNSPTGNPAQKQLAGSAPVATPATRSESAVAAQPPLATLPPVAVQPPQANRSDVEASVAQNDSIAEAQANIVQGSQARDNVTNAPPATQLLEGYGCDDIGMVGIPPNCHPGR